MKMSFCIYKGYINLGLSYIQEVVALALKDKETIYGKLSRRMELLLCKIL